MVMFTLNNAEVKHVADKIGSVCDGHMAAVIMAAMTDVLNEMIEQQTETSLTLEELLSDFVGLARQRHSDGATH